MSHDLFMANPAASRLLDVSDQTLLWGWATAGLARSESCSGELRLASRTTVAVRARRVADVPSGLCVTIELRALPAEPERADPGPVVRVIPRLTGRSLATQRLQAQLDQLATAPGPVLFTGEPGVGKAHAALLLAAVWRCAAEPLVVEASGSVGRVRSALQEGRSVVMRRLGAVDRAEVSAVRALVDEAVEAGWPLLATTGDSEADSDRSTNSHFLRQVWVAPLRDRVEELGDLAAVILKKHGAEHCVRLQPAAEQALLGHDWPGNVRELESELVSASLRARGGEIAIQHLSSECRTGSKKRLTRLERMEREALIKALEETGGNKSLTAERLGIARSTLYRKMRTHGIEDDRFPG